MADTEDIRLAQGGDVEACSRLFARHWRTVYGWLLGRTANPDRAEDLTQQTFLRAYQRLRQLRDPSRFLPWLRRVARTACSASRFHRPAIREPVRAQMPGPAALAGESESRRLVHAALDRLPVRDRSILTLVHVEELPLAQVARLLDLPVTTLRRRVATALRRFRAALDREGGNHGLHGCD